MDSVPFTTQLNQKGRGATQHKPLFQNADKLRRKTFIKNVGYTPFRLVSVIKLGDTVFFMDYNLKDINSTSEISAPNKYLSVKFIEFIIDFKPFIKQ